MHPPVSGDDKGGVGGGKSGLVSGPLFQARGAVAHGINGGRGRALCGEALSGPLNALPLCARRRFEFLKWTSARAIQ